MDWPFKSDFVLKTAFASNALCTIFHILAAATTGVLMMSGSRRQEMSPSARQLSAAPGNELRQVAIDAVHDQQMLTWQFWGERGDLEMLTWHHLRGESG